MITLEEIHKLLQQKGLTGNLSSAAGSVDLVCQEIARKVPNLLSKVGLSVTQAISDPKALDNASNRLFAAIPIPWRWLIGKKKFHALVKNALDKLPTGS